MMSDEQKRAEMLDAFLAAYQAGKAATPPTPEAELAADLVDLAASLPSESRLPSDFPPTDRFDLEEENMMLVQPRIKPTWNFSLSLVAALLLLLVVGSLLVPLIQLPALAPAPQSEARLPLPVGGYMTDLDPAALDWMRSTGMTWAVFPLHYGSVENSALLEQAQTLIGGAHEAGFRALLTISGTPEALDNFVGYAQFAGEVAALDADAIEVWSEPNLSRNWKEGEIDPVNYVDLLRQSYTAIKASNPDTLVISAAPAPTGAQDAFGSDQIWNDDVFYQGMAEAGAAEYADCIGVHYIEGAVDPTLITGDARDDYPTRYFVPMLQRAAAPFRGSGLPLCLTEFGYLSSEGLTQPLPDPFVWARNTTADQQAAWLAKGIETAAQLSSIRVEMVMVYRLTGTDDPVGDGFALIRPDGSCLACDRIAALRH
jgi:hypothetical protein